MEHNFTEENKILIMDSTPQNKILPLIPVCEKLYNHHQLYPYTIIDPEAYCLPHKITLYPNDSVIMIFKNYLTVYDITNCTQDVASPNVTKTFISQGEENQNNSKNEENMDHDLEENNSNIHMLTTKITRITTSFKRSTFNHHSLAYKFWNKSDKSAVIFAEKTNFTDVLNCGLLNVCPIILHNHSMESFFDQFKIQKPTFQKCT